MKRDWTKIQEDLENELVQRIGEKRAEQAESGTISSRNKTSGILWHIVFWVVVIGGAIALYELFRQ